MRIIRLGWSVNEIPQHHQQLKFHQMQQSALAVGLYPDPLGELERFAITTATE